MTKIKVNCLNCGQELWRSPSKVEPRNYCSKDCYAVVRNKEITERGKPFRITPHTRNTIYRNNSVPEGENHYAWKGENVSYRGLHYWLRRKLGKPTECSNCGRKDTRPRYIQWASRNGLYPRSVGNYIPLCAKCHKEHDLAMKSTQDFQSAT